MTAKEGLKGEFEKAAKNVQKLKERPTNDALLELYALYKQSTEGDVTGSRPGMLDIKGRKKFDIWSSKKGMSSEKAMQSYLDWVKKLNGGS